MNDNRTALRSGVAISLFLQESKNYRDQSMQLVKSIAQSAYDSIEALLTDPNNYSEEFEPDYLDRCFRAVLQPFQTAFNVNEIHALDEIDYIYDLVQLFYKGPSIFRYQPYGEFLPEAFERILQIYEFTKDEVDHFREMVDRLYGLDQSLQIAK